MPAHLSASLPACLPVCLSAFMATGRVIHHVCADVYSVYRIKMTIALLFVHYSLTRSLTHTHPTAYACSSVQCRRIMWLCANGLSIGSKCGGCGVIWWIGMFVCSPLWSLCGLVRLVTSIWWTSDRQTDRQREGGVDLVDG
mmetsp:Transcript_27187/g.78195  ORF Transcript_27187/g.78195 Transcript_27187/m.78195 type:complete len:141 (+) Transcript_27187:297-719(+)